jgi:DNA-binding winged helix-turn-helix (wHTH) protein
LHTFCAARHQPPTVYADNVPAVAATHIDRFGPFALDRYQRRLSADGRPITIADRHMDVLLVLTSHPGLVVAKETLIAAGWPDVAVTDYSLYQAIKELRRVLGTLPDGQPYIETITRRGFRFVAPLEQATPLDDAAIDALLEPYRAFIDGRSAIETLDAREVARARDAFARALRLQPDLTAAHIGLASAYLLQYEATRADACPDRDALTTADHHARRSCQLDPSSADAWSTLALVSHRLPQRQGDGDGSQSATIAAARKAVSLEPNEWRHHLRLGFVAGGAERLRAAHRVLALRPRLALAHWLAATVFVARQAFDAALEHVRVGCVAQDEQGSESGGFTAVGLHLLHGMLLAARGDVDAAHAELARELETAHRGHVYAREAFANAYYTIGALHRRRRDDASARTAFEDALARVPRHPLASLALAASSGTRLPSLEIESPRHDLSHMVVCAAAHVIHGRHGEAARGCEIALRTHLSAPAGPAEPGAAWLLPIEPLIDAAALSRVWARALALLQRLAS